MVLASPWQLWTLLNCMEEGLFVSCDLIFGLISYSPANFLDVGGGASEQQVTEALKIITSDPSVRNGANVPSLT